jgi:hypothetical protein
MVDEEELADLATALMILVGKHIESNKCAHCKQLFNEAYKTATASRKADPRK